MDDLGVPRFLETPRFMIGKSRVHGLYGKISMISLFVWDLTIKKGRVVNGIDCDLTNQQLCVCIYIYIFMYGCPQIHMA